MGNTEYRGKIIWFLLTCRPDLLPIDLKRQGRAEEHLALFYPQTDAERDELFRAMAKKTQGGSWASLVRRRCSPRRSKDCSRRGHRGGAGARRSSGRSPRAASSRPPRT